MSTKPIYFTILFFLSGILTNNLFGNNDTLKSVTQPEWVNDIGAKTFPSSVGTYNVIDFGAKNDGATINTQAIQSAIDICSKNGGGTVIFNEGKYLTGSLFIKEGVQLSISKNVEIIGSQNISDYTEIDTRVAGVEMKWPAALINVIGINNAAISGEGTINGNGKVFWDSYWELRKVYSPNGLRWIVDYDCKRPRTLLVANSKNVTIKGLTMQQAGFWTIHILYSSYITVDGVIIRNNIGGHGPSTDGIDIDSSEKILIKNCDIDCNDDNFCLKSGRDADGLRVNRPTEFVLITDCISRQGGGLITLGSETSGGIRNIIAQNLKAYGTGVGIRLKSATTRGGTIEDIIIKNIEMDSVDIAIDITLNWNPAYSYSKLPVGYNYDSIPDHWKVMLKKVDPDSGLPRFKNIYLSDIKARKAHSAIQASGLKNSPLINFNFTNLDIESVKAGKIKYAQGWTFKNANFKTKDGSKLETISSTDMRFE